MAGGRLANELTKKKFASWDGGERKRGWFTVSCLALSCPVKGMRGKCLAPVVGLGHGALGLCKLPISVPHNSHSEISRKAVEIKVHSFHNARTPTQGTHTHTSINPRCEGKISKRADINLFGCPVLSSSLFFSFSFFSFVHLPHPCTHTHLFSDPIYGCCSIREKRKEKRKPKRKRTGRDPFHPFPPFPIIDPTCSRLHNTKAETLLSPYRHPVRPGEALGVTADFSPHSSSSSVGVMRCVTPP